MGGASARRPATASDIPLSAAYPRAAAPVRKTHPYVDATTVTNTDETLRQMNRVFPNKKLMRSIKNKDGSVGKTYDRLVTYSRDVMPIYYRTCPMGWVKQQSVPNSDIIKKEGVLIQTGNGYCVPAADRSEEEKEADVALDMNALTRKIIMMMPQGNELRQRAIRMNEAARIQKTQEDAYKAAQRQQLQKGQVGALSNIFKNMEQYKALGREEREAAAQEYLNTATQCAAANVNNDSNGCSTTDGCQYAFDPSDQKKGFCAPDEAWEQISRDTPADEAASTRQLTKWWADYYRQYERDDKTVKAQTSRNAAYNRMTRTMGPRKSRTRSTRK